MDISEILNTSASAQGLSALSAPVRAGQTAETAAVSASGASFDELLAKVKREQNEATTAKDSQTARAKEDKALKDACKGFEAMFLGLMYKEMRKTVPKDALFGKDNAMEIYEDFRDTELAKQMADAGGIGLGDMLYRQLKPQAEAHIDAGKKKAAEDSGKAGQAQH
jgi:flagellar protein FlgJ